MTLRAFLIGLLCVIGLCLLDPYTSFNKGYGWNTVGHFPPGAVFFLVLLTIGANVVIKLLKKSWALCQAELMLVWCMVMVAAIVPSDGLMRWWFPMLAGPPYLARRADVTWKDTALAGAPELLVLSKQPGSIEAKRFYEGQPEEARIPWRPWLTPIACWLALMVFFYLATFFLCAILRKQWAERERLQFPLARVPLEFTEGSQEQGWLPRLFSNRAFVIGVIATTAFRFLRDVPLFFGKTSGWGVPIPLKDVLASTPLEHLYLENFDLWWSPIGFAFLVPADVSLSVWFFYLLGRSELQVAYWLNSDTHYGGTWSALMRWQIAGSYMIFTLGALFMARRHIADVVRKAVGLGRDVDDRPEPVGYGVSFWGLLICTAGAVGWFVFFGMPLWVALTLFALLMCIMFVQARIVAQSGLYITTSLWQAPNIMNGLSLGRVFNATGAVVANMQYGIMMDSNYSMLSPPAIHAFRISEVFERRRKLLLPALFVALMAGIIASSYTCLCMAYSGGALNYSDDWGSTGNPTYRFELSHMEIERPSEVDPAKWSPFGLGIVLTGFVMFMRARFYWWPIHPIGLLGISNWHIDRIWLPFLIGWLTKVLMMKFGSGRLIQQARFFFIGLILVESFVDGVSTIVRTVSAGHVPGF